MILEMIRPREPLVANLAGVIFIRLVNSRVLPQLGTFGKNQSADFAHFSQVSVGVSRKLVVSYETFAAAFELAYKGTFTAVPFHVNLEVVVLLEGSATAGFETYEKLPAIGTQN